MYQITSDLHKVCPVMGILVLEILGEQNFGRRMALGPETRHGPRATRPGGQFKGEHPIL